MFKKHIFILLSVFTLATSFAQAGEIMTDAPQADEVGFAPSDKPYEVAAADNCKLKEKGGISWYNIHNETASGQMYTTKGIHFAHKTLAMRTKVKVCNGARCVVGTVNDRGPYAPESKKRKRIRILDANVGARDALGFSGTATVSLYVCK